jgi:hypothetical protein
MNYKVSLIEASIHAAFIQTVQYKYDLSWYEIQELYIDDYFPVDF